MTKYQLACGVTLEEADGVFVFLKDNGDAAVPDKIGGTITKVLLENGLQGAMQHVSEAYGVDTQTAERDVKEFVQVLQDRGLIKETS